MAHVDAGKTSMAEAMLYKTGAIRQLGRVDHKDAFLDTQRLERRRGITIFSKQAIFDLGDTRVTLLDTPGHMDFSAEMERTLSVLDYAILVISGPDGVQAHTATVWALLQRYQVPTFLWINKMDLVEAAGPDERGRILQLLQGKLSPHCIDMAAPDAAETMALADEAALDEFLADGKLSKKWVYDSGFNSSDPAYGCGNHNLMVPLRWTACRNSWTAWQPASGKNNGLRIPGEECSRSPGRTTAHGSPG